MREKKRREGRQKHITWAHVRSRVYGSREHTYRYSPSFHLVDNRRFFDRFNRITPCTTRFRSVDSIYVGTAIVLSLKKNFRDVRGRRSHLRRQLASEYSVRTVCLFIRRLEIIIARMFNTSVNETVNKNIPLPKDFTTLGLILYLSRARARAHCKFEHARFDLPTNKTQSPLHTPLVVII